MEHVLGYGYGRISDHYGITVSYIFFYNVNT
jgi:hypothetical protein